MNIRSLTGFLSLDHPLSGSALDPRLDSLGELVKAARTAFSDAAMPIQTARVARQFDSTTPPGSLVQFARTLEQECRARGIDYASLGAVQVTDLDARPELIDEIPAALAATENIFASIRIAARDGERRGIHLRAVHATARMIRALADARPDGFGAFRFAALANCPPHSPFFPVAYHDGGEPAFAVATEGAPLAVEAFSTAPNLDAARASLIESVEAAARSITRIAERLAAQFSFRFAGIDFSLAPFPKEPQSIGTAIERLTGVPFGEHGTLFAAAFITDCLNRAKFRRTGFSGLMLPVLEDATLAARSAHYTVDSLLLYSAVCGTGLDTIPLPGDTSADALAAILLDLATLAVKLDKPLTARLVPLPGLVAGDLTHFDFAYCANARVLGPQAHALKIFDSNVSVEFTARS